MNISTPPVSLFKRIAYFNTRLDKAALQALTA